MTKFDRHLIFRSHFMSRDWKSTDTKSKDGQNILLECYALEQVTKATLQQTNKYILRQGKDLFVDIFTNFKIFQQMI